MHHFGKDAEREDADDDRSQDRVALWRIHGSDYVKDRNRQFPAGTTHGERDYVTRDLGRTRVAGRWSMSGYGARIMSGATGTAGTRVCRILSGSQAPSGGKSSTA